MGLHVLYTETKKTKGRGFFLLFYFDFPPVPAKFSTTQPTVFLSILNILVASISSHSLSGLNDWVLKREKRYSSMRASATAQLKGRLGYSLQWSRSKGKRERERGGRRGAGRNVSNELHG